MNKYLFYWYMMDVLKSLTPLAIGLFAAWIAYRQWRTSNDKIRLDFFDRRYKIYDAAVKFHDSFIKHNAVDNDALGQFEHESRQAAFLLASEDAKF